MSSIGIGILEVMDESRVEQTRGLLGNLFVEMCESFVVIVLIMI